MKNNFTLPALVAALALSFWTGCATSNIQLQVLSPAGITVSNEFKHLALVNRFYPTKEDKVLGVIEGALTGENFGQDRRAAESALGGLTEALAGSPRFTITRPNREIQGTGRGDFPPPIAIATVQEVCNMSNAQALVTIEAFDSDTRLACVAEKRTRKTKEGVTEEYIVYKATKNVDVTVGWRLYDGRNGAVADEFRMFETVRFFAEGATEAIAIANLPNRDYMTREIGRVTGLRYSARISPTWNWISRTYYGRGNDALKVAKRAVKVNDFERAAQYWTKAQEDPKLKVKGRATYNMALSAEIDGRLEDALEIAREAYRQYGNNKARQYTFLLEQRINDQQRLDQQMEGAEK
jgi:hypothetical protein